MNCYTCGELLDDFGTVECADGHTHCMDCADELIVECETCGGGGVTMGVVRATDLSPPEITCGMCNGAGVIEHGTQERGIPTADDFI